MKKHVPKMRRLTIPVILLCLPLQPIVAVASTPDNSRMGLDLRLIADIALKGRVTDEKGQGLPGVNVVVKGTTNGAQTDADGNFALTAPDNATLVISYVGYIAQEVAVGGRATVNVSLAPDAKALSEVVVVGYVTQDRQNLTSAVSSLDVNEAIKTPVPNIAQSIQGRVAGVQVESAGNPGSVPNIIIRGVGTVGSGSNPLYVIDGLWTDNIRDLNPNDVESTTVLKDASSTAVYGARGANGVILITTKRGQSGEPKISFNGYTGVENIYRKYNLANHSQWADWANQAAINAGIPSPSPGAVKGTPAYSDAVNTDWQKEFFQTGKIQDYNLSFSGGSSAGKNSTNFLISGGYFNQDGIVKGPKFERYSVRLNSGLTRGRLKLGQSALLTHINTTLLNEVPFVDVLTELPGIPVYNPANFGGYGYGSANLFNYSVNPIAAQEILNRTQKNNRLQGSANAEFSFFDFLSYRLNLGLEIHDYNDRNARREGYIRLGESNNNTTYLFENRGTQRFLLVENTLNFNKRFGDHNVTALLGYSEQTYHQDNATANATGFPSSPQYFFVLGAGTNLNTPPSVGGGIDEYAKRSYFSQLNYDYKGRYLVTGSFRRDGSSRFDPDRRYANFGAGSLGWRVSEEDFFKNSVSFINNLKLRASYGVNGNDQLGDAGNYAYQATVNQTIYYPLGTTQTLVNGAIQPSLESRGIRWESRYTTNFGLDMALLDNRLTLSTDYYISTTKNALVNPPLPGYGGVAGAGAYPFANLGEIENRGFELALGYHETRKAFTYGADLTLTTLRNKVLALSELQPNVPGFIGTTPVTRTTVGQPISRLYLLKMIGVFQNEEEIQNYRGANGNLIQPLAKPGDVKFEDTNGDGTINFDTDRQFVGNPFPKLQYGLNLSAAYKGIDLSIFFQGVTGNDILNSTRASLDILDGAGNFRSDIEPWTPENGSNTTPRLVYGGGAGQVKNYERASTRWVEDGSYLRLRNIQIGYTFPQLLTSKVPSLGSVRVYVTGRNVFTATKYTGFDPETPGLGIFGRGLDDGTYPNVRTFTAGLQVNF
ncbi:SusC/RagA family TonB-linked outer membrane protein [Hymenobacter cavernae]|uniref:SusC/RagA family TonB-linked outer membrane protein n=1 Tax=Hymenobacter cavernae TaxID=2044852 RepID=A0ABQ1UPD0_9BACT|nr:TonB-dependent receptor [Hymenobacter cavernae]GGF21880.1 SusC/RagA family TonB-linked outer membrane protein [Hymenobacter cavernae]